MVDARKAKFPCLAPDDERVFNVVEKPHAFWIERVRAYEVLAGKQRQAPKVQ
jgi:hypothetical protein